MEDYQPMKFEFPDEDIMMVNNYDEFRPYDGPEKGSWWTLVFDGDPTHSTMALVLYLYPPKDIILRLLQDFASIVQLTWLNTKRASLVSKLP